MPDKLIFWTRPRANRIALILILTLLAAIFIQFSRDRNQTSLLRQGDFPAFYSAARILSDGRGEQLYDFELQSSIQNRIWDIPGEKSFLPFVYPPYTAVIHLPLAALSPQTGKILYSAIMLLFLILFVQAGRVTAPLLGANPLVLAALLLGFFPVSFAALGGQNITLGMLLYAGILALLHRSSTAADFAAGLLAGLWCYKPHYGGFMILFLLFSRRWASLAGALIVLTLYYALAAQTLGFDWMAIWGAALHTFGPVELLANSVRMISLPGISEAFWGTPLPGYALALPFLVFASARMMSSSGQPDRIVNALCLAGPVMVLVSPHTLYYDIGLCVLPCARFMKLKTDRAISMLAGSVVLISTAAFAGQETGLSRLATLSAIAVFFIVARRSTPQKNI